MRSEHRLLLSLVIALILQSALCSANDLEVIFSHKRGYYNHPFTLSLTSSDPTAIIRFTTDCSVPSMQTGENFETAIQIDSTTVVKAIAYSSTDTSVLETHTFLFPEDIIRQDNNPTGYPVSWGGSTEILADYEMDQEVINDPAYSGKILDAIKSIPALCLSMSIDAWFNHGTGNYVAYPNSDIIREKPVSAEFIYSDGDNNFGINCGVRNQGGTSIVNWKVPKQSMRLLFKEQYGPKKLNKKLFPDSDIESINTLVVDALLYSWYHNFDRTQRQTALYFRDQLCSDLQNDMGGLSFHGFYVNLYINGLYWGIYDLHERPDEDFMEEYYDTDKDNFDVIKHNPYDVVHGSNDSYLEMLEFIRGDLTSNESLQEVQEYLDLPDFIDYIVLNYYLGNFDWAHQNYYAAYDKVQKTGYRFYTWDAEHVMRYSDVEFDATTTFNSDAPTEIQFRLEKNDDYRMMFADAFYKHAFNEGALSPGKFEERFMYRKNELNLAIILESARWGDYREYLDNVTYTRDDYWIPEVNKVINEYIPNRRAVVIDQLRRSDNNLFPDTYPPVFSRKGGLITAGESVEIINPNSGGETIVYTTNGTDPRQPGGAIGGMLYESAIEISDPVLIKARTLTPGTNEWSALAEAYFVTEALENSIMISEIMYHSGNNGIEFIELMNAGNTNIDLYGLSFIDGIEYTFRENTPLSSGAFLVLTNEMEPFEAQYNFKAYDVYRKNLSNSGETILLADYYGNIIDSVTYADSLPWPVYADGYYRSLELIDPGLDNALATSWKASDALNGTPVEYINSISGVMPPNTIELLIYPNPVTDWLTIVFPDRNFTNKSMSVAVYNNLGQLVKRIAYSGSNSQIYLGDLDAGIYYLHIGDSKGREKATTTKLIKLK